LEGFGNNSFGVDRAYRVVAQPSMRRTATEELPHIRHAKPARFKARSTQKEGIGNKKPRARQRTGLLFVTPAQQTRH